MGGFERLGKRSLVEEARIATEVTVPGKRTLVEDISPPQASNSRPVPRPIDRGDGGTSVQRRAIDGGHGDSDGTAGRSVANHQQHAAPANVAERDTLNAVIRVVARDEKGTVVGSWRSRARWVGPLPVRYHGEDGERWHWNEPAAAATRIHTHADGSGGVSVETWAAQHHAARVDVIAESVDAAGDENRDAREDVGSYESGGGGRDAFTGADRDLERVAQFEAQIGMADGGRGDPEGDPLGRLGQDTSVAGTGAGGPKARSGGDTEGAERPRPDGIGNRFGDELGEGLGDEPGRFGGEGRSGSHGVREAGAVLGGVIAVPAAIQSVVEVLLLAQAGDITGQGEALFSKLGKEAAQMSATALRELVAREARIASARELEATINKLTKHAKWLALTAEERARAIRVAYFELQRRFMRGFRSAAEVTQRRAGQALRHVVGARRAIAQESVDAGRIGVEAAEVEPVAGRLPRNHEFAGKEFSREQLPPKYRANGLRFKQTGYPDFEPYALVLPNGKKTVKITLTGSRRGDEALANRAAGFRRQPELHTWHHVENEGTMMLVPTDLHRAVGHTGGASRNVDRTGIVRYGD